MVDEVPVESKQKSTKTMVLCNDTGVASLVATVLDLPTGFHGQKTRPITLTRLSE